MSRLSSFVVALSLGIFAAIGQTHAQSMTELTFYGGLSVGQASIDTGVSGTTGTASLDEDDVGFKVFGGVNINEYLGVEAFYVDLGEASLTGNNGDTFVFRGTTYTFTANNVDIELEGSSFGVVPMLGYDVTEQFRPFVKAGVHFWETEATVSSSAGGANLSDDGSDLVLGVGFTFDVTEHVGVRAEYERLSFDDEDVDYLSAGVQYNF